MHPCPEVDLAIQTKRALRKRMRSLRSALPEAAHAARSRRVVENVLALPEVHGAAAVAVFAPMLDKAEIDLRALDAALRGSRVRLYYPFMDPLGDGRFATGFREVPLIEELAPRGRGFAEPDPARPAARRGDIDVVVVPALAVDARGYRIGYGGGVYDATLPDICPPARSVVVAFDFQLLVELPVTEADIPCEIVVTDRQVLRCVRTGASASANANANANRGTL